MANEGYQELVAELSESTRDMHRTHRAVIVLLGRIWNFRGS